MTPIVAIVGRPNVGKSTLFNRLSRSRDALVDNRPGITRDRLYALIEYEGVLLNLVDTGGFEGLTGDPLFRQIVVQVEKAIEEADKVIFMVDGRQGLMPGDEEMASKLRKRQKKTVLAVNKIDGPELDHLALEFHRLGIPTLCGISAAHGYGVRTLMHGLVQDLPKPESEKGPGSEIRIAVLGRPNVGKSSLINRILGQDRLVVSEEPGTTRDAVDTHFNWGGNDYVLIDTAGIRRKSKVRKKIEKFSVMKALRTLDRCHVAVILLDAAEGISEQDSRICGYAQERGKGIVLGINKWDLIKSDPGKRILVKEAILRQLKFVSFAPRVHFSALTGERVMKLFPVVDLVYGQFCQRIHTAALNHFLQEVTERNPPPRAGLRKLKFLYMTQASTMPPTFIVFGNQPDLVHFSYERFLVNQMRGQFGLDCTPIKLLFRRK